MKDISNSTLALFVVAAIVISVFGTMLSVNRLNNLESTGLTGMLSTNTSVTGYANLSVPSAAYINITDNTILLGQISPGESNASQNKDDYWIIQNDGTVNISIRLYSPSADDQDGKPGRGPFTATINSTNCLQFNDTRACFRVACVNSSSAFGVCNTTYDALPVNAQGPGYRFLLQNLSPDLGNDTAFFGVNATVPDGESAGNKDQYVEFLAAES